MDLPKEVWDLRKTFDPSLRFSFSLHLRGTHWRHYKGDRYVVIGILWDSTAEEWAVEYKKPDENDMRFSRTVTDWFSRPFVGSEEPRYRKLSNGKS